MKACSIFAQVLKVFSRGEFERAVKEHKAERHARSGTSWSQFVALLFCRLGRAFAARDICGGLACCEGQLRHLGVPVAPKKSTLAYANENRPWELYQTVFEQTLFKCQDLVRSQDGRNCVGSGQTPNLDASDAKYTISEFTHVSCRSLARARTKSAVRGVTPPLTKVPGDGILPGGNN